MSEIVLVLVLVLMLMLMLMLMLVLDAFNRPKKDSAARHRTRQGKNVRRGGACPAHPPNPPHPVHPAHPRSPDVPRPEVHLVRVSVNVSDGIYLGAMDGDDSEDSEVVPAGEYRTGQDRTGQDRKGAWKPAGVLSSLALVLVLVWYAGR
jgi:hypothetical protein